MRSVTWDMNSTQAETISDEVYFRSEPWCDYISNSKLNLVDPSLGGSIELFERSFQSKRRSKGFQMGTIVHTLILQSPDYGVSDMVKPSGKLGEITYTVFKLRSQDPKMTIAEAIAMSVKVNDYYKGKPSENILKKAMKEGLPYYRHLRLWREKEYILTSQEVETTLGCITSLQTNEKIRNLIFPKAPVLSFNEHAMSVDVQLDDRTYTVKIKIDSWTIDVDKQIVVLNDLKTSGVGLHNFVNGYWETYPTDTDTIRIFHPGSFQKYKYYRQLALYAKVLSLYVEKNFGFKPTIIINIVAVETRAPYLSRIFNFGIFDKGTFSQNQLKVGYEDLIELLWLLKDNNYEPKFSGVSQQPCAFI